MFIGKNSLRDLQPVLSAAQLHSEAPVAGHASGRALQRHSVTRDALQRCRSPARCASQQAAVAASCKPTLVSLPVPSPAWQELLAVNKSRILAVERRVCSGFHGPRWRTYHVRV